VEPIDHLFRREAGRMVSALTRVFGVQNLALAEDVVQDALCRALEVWKFRGVPENPSAWLMTSARNRAIDLLRQHRTARTFAPELSRWLESEWTLSSAVDELLGSESADQDLLRMMFSCCHPRLKEEAQIALVLHILCGFSVGEIAAAFLSSESAIEKRISRSKKVLTGAKKLFEVDDREGLGERLPAVQRALYLLFNEGYHGACPESAVRMELCQEAMRLASVLAKNPLSATPSTQALSALMCFHAARLPARIDSAGHLLSLLDQDRARWTPDLISEGRRLLDLSARGSELSEYHIEAAIASVHASAPRLEDTNWDAIISMYDQLMRIRPSPVVELNRAIAVGQRDGPESGLEAIRAIEGAERLIAYPFYEAALGELELRARRPREASDHFRAALAVARNPTERRFLEERLKESLSEAVGHGA
jgi:RNA polymerase sigma-70 factor (ECF subfamily)